MKKIVTVTILLCLLAQSAHADLRNGLVGWWKFDETSGTTAYDSSGNNNTGTITNGPTSASNCARGGCLNFDGSNDYVNVSSSSSLNITGAITLSYWLNSTDGDAGHITKSVGPSYFAGTGQKLYEVGFLTNTIYFQISDSSNLGVASGSATSVMDGKWHHILCVWDGTTGANGMKIYFDNVLKYQATANNSSIQTYGGGLEIGGGATPYRTTGQIDDVRIYNRAVTAVEVGDLYRSGAVVKNAVLRNVRFKM